MNVATDLRFVKSIEDKSIEDLVMDKLEKLSKKFDWIVSADVYLKDEKDSKQRGKICEIRLSVPGPRIFASSDEESFEESVAETIRDLMVQLVKRKDKLKRH